MLKFSLMKKFWREDWFYALGGLLALVLFFLRLYHLTILPVFADEAIYIRWSQVMRAEETLRFLPLSDGKEPLFMWLVIPFLKIFQDPLFAGRFVSVLSGFGTLIGTTFLSWLLFKSKKVTLTVATIYAVSPFVFFFDRMSLVDSLLSMFAVWTFIFSYLAVTAERLDFAMIAGFALGGAWLTKSPALFFALMLPTLWLYVKRPRSMLKVILLTAVTVLIGYGFFNILRLGPNFSLIATRNLDYVYPLSHILATPLDPLRPFLDRSFQWIVMTGPWGILVLSVLSYFINWRRYWRTLLVLTIWFLVPIVIQSEFAKVLTARYILFSIPYLIILAGSVFREEKRVWLTVLTVVLAFFVVQSLVFDYYLMMNPAKANLPRSERSGYLEEWTAGTGIKQVADYLFAKEAEDPKTKIVVGTEGFFGTLPDGLEIYLNNHPEIIVIGTGLDFTNPPQSLSDSKKSGNDTYLVVNNERFNGNSIKQGLKLVASYPKGVRPDGSRQSLLLYQLTR